MIDFEITLATANPIQVKYNAKGNANFSASSKLIRRSAYPFNYGPDHAAYRDL